MSHQVSLPTRLFETPRLFVDEVTSNLSGNLRTELLVKIVKLLSPQVVQSLPLYFHGISSQARAETWFNKMSDESRFLMVKNRAEDSLIGFIFLYTGEGAELHIGYLLGEQYWGKGYAKEFLSGLISWCSDEASVNSIIGGVEKDNMASSRLLESLGFTEKKDGGDASVVFYEYLLS